MPNGEAKGELETVYKKLRQLPGRFTRCAGGKTIGARALTPSAVDRTKVIVNEIGNSNTDMDWVEFRNLSETDAYNLKNHHLSYVKSDAVADWS